MATTRTSDDLVKFVRECKRRDDRELYFLSSLFLETELSWYLPELHPRFPSPLDIPEALEAVGAYASKMSAGHDGKSTDYKKKLMPPIKRLSLLAQTKSELLLLFPKIAETCCNGDSLWQQACRKEVIEYCYRAVLNIAKNRNKPDRWEDDDLEIRHEIRKDNGLFGLLIEDEIRQLLDFLVLTRVAKGLSQALTLGQELIKAGFFSVTSLAVYYERRKARTEEDARIISNFLALLLVNESGPTAVYDVYHEHR